MIVAVVLRLAHKIKRNRVGRGDVGNVIFRVRAFHMHGVSAVRRSGSGNSSLIAISVCFPLIVQEGSAQTEFYIGQIHSLVHTDRPRVTHFSM